MKKGRRAPKERSRDTMAKGKGIVRLSEVKKAVGEDARFLKSAVEEALQGLLEEEMEETVGAGRYERTDRRRGYRSGYRSRELLTRVGKIELRVPQDREGRFSTELFERYQRSERALVSTLVESYIQGVSTRKVKEICEQLCGHELSASTVSRMVQRLDKELTAFANRPLCGEGYPYLILDARYEKVREEGVIRSQAVLVAIGVGWDGRREVLGVELASRESLSSWYEFVKGLKERGLRGVELVVSDDHEGLKSAVARLLPEAAWQRCYVHSLRNALDYLPRKADDDCLTELRWLYDRRNLQEARADLQRWLEKWEGRYGRLCGWVEENIEETFTFYRLPVQHHKHMKSTNMLERLNQELKRRTHVVRIFPNAASCLRLVRALACEIHEDWLEGPRYLDMSLLRDQRRAQQLAAIVPSGPEQVAEPGGSGLCPAMPAVPTS